MQMALMKWAAYHPICRDHLIHIANERLCSIGEGVKLKALGVKSGVWDNFLSYPTKSFPGLWIELKVKDNKLSANQVRWGELMQAAGYATAIVWDDWLKAKNIIESYLDDHFAMPQYGS